ncbi:MAG TPA: carbohydrate ABC transporter permease [Clostridiaceae bacterium]
MLRSKTFGSKIADALIWFIIIIITFVCLAPLINIVAVSLSSKASAAGNLVYLWPVKFNLSSYKTLLSDKQFFVSFGISIQRVILGGAINMFLTILMAYPLSKEVRQFKYRNIYMWFIVFTMLFNGGLIPWYLTIKNLHLLNTIWALVIPGAVPIFNVILLMNFFRSVPKSLEEAAVVDGAGPWYTMFKIYVPISLPALATITLFCVVGHWNDFFHGLILMSSPAKYPLQTYIQQLTVQVSTLNLTNPEDIKRFAEISNRTLNSAKIVVSTIPLLLIYPFLQKYFITGIVMGSVKE